MQFTVQHENPDDRGISRYFTISSAPFEQDIMITTRYEFEKPSTFKKALFSLEKNQEISAFPPRGEFVLSDFSKSYVFIAGGIGITPFRSILADLDYKKTIGDIEICLLYANRNDEIVFKDELDVLAGRYRSFKVRYVISPERCDMNHIKAAVPDYLDRVYYISGPPGLVKSVENELHDGGIAKTDLNLDYFPGY
jgi:ferredoxin-NADP reductase